MRKIRLWANFSGVLRGSEVARWMATDRGLRASLVRLFVNLKSGQPGAKFDDLASIGGDPWFATSRRMPADLVRDLLVINVAVIPEGPKGWSEMDPLFSFLGKQAATGRRTIGPCDGLVESAAAVLPPRAGVSQWVVRLRGSHALLDARYLDGSLVTPGYAEKGEARMESGLELMDDFFRALPKSAVDL